VASSWILFFIYEDDAPSNTHQKMPEGNSDKHNRGCWMQMNVLYLFLV